MSPADTRLRIARLLRRHWQRLGLALLLGLCALLAAFGLLVFSGQFIVAAAIAGSGAATAAAFDIFRPGALIRLFALVRTASRYGERLVAHDVLLRLLQTLRSRTYARLAALTPEPLARWSEGELLQRLVADVDALNEAPLRAGLPLAAAGAVVIAALIVAALVERDFLLPVAVALLLAALVVPLATACRSRRDGRQLAQCAAVRRDGLVDALRGLTTLLLCGAWPQWREAWLAEDRALLSAQFAQRVRESLGQAVAALTIGAGTCALVAVVASHDAPAFAAPGFAAAILGLLASAEALAPMTAAWLAWGRARAAAQRIGAVLASAPAITFPTSPASLPPPRGALELRRVSYIYPARSAGLAELTLSIAPGARLCVSGVSGAGKSTLAALLARSLDPASGDIRLDSVDLRDYDEAALRSRVALLPQRPHLFAASVAENLRIADPQADDARLQAVLQAVALDAWLAQLPQGLATPLGEYGTGLSGGEARRLALARTLLRPAAVFVLDEPYEGLDAALRARVAAGVDAWIGEATLVLISHHAVTIGVEATSLTLQPLRVA
ncbi:MAG: thiol reductant ABC exporter subunit CydC [Rhodanobacteraceae bacterium]|nr:thiol reductant ABC exporter subunit CydC [Rhodanobacteraceae bacterium]